MIDIAQVDRFAAEVLSAMHAGCFDPPWSAATMTEILDGHGAAAWIAARDAAPVGFLIGRRTLDEAEILTFGVLANHRRGGVGQSLVRSALDQWRAEGVRAAFLEVAYGNGIARRLYHRAGFRAVGQRPGYYHHADGRRETALVLRWER